LAAVAKASRVLLFVAFLRRILAIDFFAAVFLGISCDLEIILREITGRLAVFRG
jgi:hypothetical protein